MTVDEITLIGLGCAALLIIALIFLCMRDKKKVMSLKKIKLEHLLRIDAW